VLEPVSFSTRALVRIAEESDKEELSKEDTREEEQQVNEESLLKSQPNQDVEEGELPPDKPKNFGRRSNKEVREEMTSKEKAQGKQLSIENSMHTSTRKGGTKGADLPTHGSRASSTPCQ